jgi:hypothetical protein
MIRSFFKLTRCATFSVIPAKAGIRCFITDALDSCFCTNDRELEKAALRLQ